MAGKLNDAMSSEVRASISALQQANTKVRTAVANGSSTGQFAQAVRIQLPRCHKDIWQNFCQPSVPENCFPKKN